MRLEEALSDLLGNQVEEQTDNWLKDRVGWKAGFPLKLDVWQPVYSRTRPLWAIIPDDAVFRP